VEVMKLVTVVELVSTLVAARDEGMLAEYPDQLELLIEAEGV
jgi:hypothetical protein